MSVHVCACACVCVWRENQLHDDGEKARVCDAHLLCAAPFFFCASFRSLAKAVTEKAELAGHADAPRILRAFKWCVLSEHRAKEKAWKGRADI